MTGEIQLTIDRSGRIWTCDPPRPERGTRLPYGAATALTPLIRAAASKNSRFGTDFGTQLFVTRCQSKEQAGTTERESSIKPNFANTTQH